MIFLAKSNRCVVMLEFPLNKKSMAVTILVLLSSCGGSSDPDTAPMMIDELPVVEVPKNPAGCTNVQYTILSADDNEEADPEYPAANVIDGKTDIKSRWSSLGTAQEITFDLGEVKSVGSLKIKWYLGAERQASFSIETSNDQNTWQNVLTESTSSGRHSGFEQVDLNPSDA